MNGPPGAGTGAAAGPSREDIVFGRAVIAFQLATKAQVEAAAAEQKRYQSQGHNVTLAQVLVQQKLISVDQYRRLVQEIQNRSASSASGGAHDAIPGGPGASSAARSGLDLRGTTRLPPANGDGAVSASQRPRPATPPPTPSAPPPSPQPAGRPKLLLPPDVTPSGRYVPSKLGQHLQGGSQFPNGAAPVPTESELEEAAKSWEESRDKVRSQNDSMAQTQDAPPDGGGSSGDPGFEIVESTGSLDKPAPAALSGSANKKVTTPQAAKERRDAGIRKMLGVAEDAEQFDFGPYRILGEVASGGMGIIYRAVETATGSVYALKALLNVETANDKQLKRFVAEAQSAMRLDHPGIVKIYDLGVYENIPYFTMDMIPGKDLHHILREKSLSTEKVLKILKKVCEAVDYAHQQNVIHRDLKPANIIVRPDEIPVLTDFGLAKNLDSQHKLTAENAMVGTPLYLSPEQVAGKANLVDGRCDVYGLGVMLYQVLTDRLPFFGRNPYEVYRKVTEEDPTPPTQINPAISPEIEKVCLQALAKDREERYATAKLMADDIGRFLKGEPVTAKLPTPAKKRPASDTPAAAAAGGGTAKGSGKAPLWLWIGVVLFALVILGGIGFIVHAIFLSD